MARSTCGARTRRRAAPRVERRLALAALVSKRAGHSRGGEARRRPCDTLSRARQIGRRVHTARPGARAAAPRAEERLRSGRDSEPRPDVRGFLGAGELLLLLGDRSAGLRGERGLRKAGKEPCVQLDRGGWLARFAGLARRFEQQPLL